MNFEVSNVVELPEKKNSGHHNFHYQKCIQLNGLIELIVNDFVEAEELVVELSNIQKIMRVLSSNEAKTCVHDNDADTGPAGS